MSRALLSVYDKKNIAEFALFLRSIGMEIVSSGGTARELREHNISVSSVDELTGFPEIMEGRVKTLHPKIHGGILARRDRPDDMETLSRHSIDTVDWVVVNLYPFEEMRGRGLPEKELLEFIDIGGPSMLRAAAKNYHHVAVVCDPEDYPWIIAEVESTGALSIHSRRYLAAKVFRRSSDYDRAIAEELER
ncbi:MAG TPA: hypothetical protein ENN41_07975 [Sediminispirochaeta sp.]|nr:hypothetical protein [Sediminispirochaeta sp.]